MEESRGILKCGEEASLGKGGRNKWVVDGVQSPFSNIFIYMYVLHIYQDFGVKLTRWG